MRENIYSEVYPPQYPPKMSETTRIAVRFVLGWLESWAQCIAMWHTGGAGLTFSQSGLLYKDVVKSSLNFDFNDMFILNSLSSVNFPTQWIL